MNNVPVIGKNHVTVRIGYQADGLHAGADGFGFPVTGTGEGIKPVN